MFDRRLDGNNQNKLMKVGLVFKDADEFRSYLADYCIQERFEVYKPKNETKRIKAVCKGEDCPWMVYASQARDKSTVMVKTLNPTHTCKRIQKNSKATAAWIARKLADQLQADPDMKDEAMVAALKKYNVFDTSYMQLYRARKIAKQENMGNYAKSYSNLVAYGKTLIERNPGTLFKLQYDSDNTDPSHPRFKRLFVCIQACKLGFSKGCRPFIGLDGCHLKGTYGGVLLAAVAMDGNNGLFPVAFGIAEVECKDSWEFFLNNLYAALHTVTDPSTLTFMSDKQKGLSQAIMDIFPDAQHRFYCRHLYQNFKVKFPGLLLKTHFWAAAKSPNSYYFKKAMASIKEENPEAEAWLMKNPLSMWARHAFDTRACNDQVTNNISEDSIPSRVTRSKSTPASSSSSAQSKNKARLAYEAAKRKEQRRQAKERSQGQGGGRGQSGGRVQARGRSQSRGRGQSGGRGLM